MILSGLQNAFDRSGRATSTSPRLNNSDFEHAMAVVESVTPGKQIVLGKRTFPALHFTRKADDDLARMRSLASRIAHTLRGMGTLTRDDALGGWVRRVTDDRTDRLQDLNYTELYNLIEGLKAFARRHGVKVI